MTEIKTELIPIKEHFDENEELIKNPQCEEIIHMTTEFYKRVGFMPPWIGYCVIQNGNLVGSAGFKGQPVNGSIEIAYGTYEMYRKKGIGTEICKELVDLTLRTDPTLKITARTMPEENFSTKILTKNKFIFNGVVTDPEDGEVWEWVYINA